MRGNEVMVLDSSSAEMSPGLKFAPHSVIEAVFDQSDLSWIRESPPKIPAHLDIYYNDFYDKFVAEMPEDLVHLNNIDEKMYEVLFGQNYESPIASYFIRIGEYKIEETGGWITSLNLTLYYSHKKSEIEAGFNKVGDLVIATIFDILSPGSGAELRRHLFDPIFNKKSNEIEYVKDGYLYKCWRGNAEQHPDFLEREYVHLRVTSVK